METSEDRTGIRKTKSAPGLETKQTFSWNYFYYDCNKICLLINTSRCGICIGIHFLLWTAARLITVAMLLMLLVAFRK